jgi:hypothetical protein
MPAIVNQFTQAAKAQVRSATPKECSVSLEEFCRNAKPVKVTIEGQEVLLFPSQFNSGSFGWGSGNKNATIQLANGQTVEVVAVRWSLVVKNSKAAIRPETAEEPAEETAEVG